MKGRVYMKKVFAFIFVAIFTIFSNAYANEIPLKYVGANGGKDYFIRYDSVYIVDLYDSDRLIIPRGSAFHFELISPGVDGIGFRYLVGADRNRHDVYKLITIVEYDSNGIVLKERNINNPWDYMRQGSFIHKAFSILCDSINSGEIDIVSIPN